MNSRIVKLIIPAKPVNKNLINISESPVPVSKGINTIYKTVDFFEQNIFLKKKIKTITKTVKDKIQLRNIINLHNNNGIKDILQIKKMVHHIALEKNILSPTGMPNIKLVKTKSRERVLFDGHHSMLAYMISGKKYLHEIPHLIVEDEKDKFVSDKDILVFFGEHAKEIKNSEWRDYVINWQALYNKQLCKREQENMGELLDSL
ncbi:hypothetical protein JXB41_06655 [Candidatus Woesearchaeota archaeon]|nr:hypothetical protein [Candidatus Woesearchaeota archaeon]